MNRFIFFALVLAAGVGCSSSSSDAPAVGAPQGTGARGGAGGGADDPGAASGTSGGPGGSAGGVDPGSSGAGGSVSPDDDAGATPVPDAGGGLPTADADPGPPPLLGDGGSSLVGKKGLWDLPGLLRIRAQAATGPLKPAYDRVIAQATTALTAGPFSVMNKTTTPPSGDKHDYMGLARYFWPNPATPTGLPYVQMDGVSNPDVDTAKYDYRSMVTMASSVTNLGLAYFLSGNERYAQKAHDLLNTWYIDPATKMNPNLNFAQSVPGVADGRKEGIIDTLQMAMMIDSLEMLRSSPAFTSAEFDALTTWFTTFLGWLRTNPLGMGEEAATNNHGSYYDLQTMRYAIFLGNTALATQLAELVKTRRIPIQVNPDGSEPLELSRTNSLFYSEYGLTANFGVAQLAADVGVDLFGFQTTDGRSLRKALDFLTPYADPAKVWPYPQITLDDRSQLVSLLRRASIAYSDPTYEQTLEMYYASALPSHIVQLVYPK